MTVAVLSTLAVIAVLVAYGLFKADCWRRTPVELRGDWWERFERQFRAFAAATASMNDSSKNEGE